MSKLRKFLCNILDWHKPTYIVIEDVISYSYCRYCEEEIMRDSQGNWFRVRGGIRVRGKNV